MRTMIFFGTALLCLALCPAGARAQLVEEWVNQKATQRKYLLQQIAALKVQIGHIRETYRIARQGLDIIGGETGVERDMHGGFFRSLGTVNPEIAAMPEVREMAELYQGVQGVRRASMEELGAVGGMSAEELAYISGVHDRVAADCAQLIEELGRTAENSRLQMKDDERFSRITDLHAQMLSNYRFARSFSAAAVQVAHGRREVRMGVENQKRINGINR